MTEETKPNKALEKNKMRSDTPQMILLGCIFIAMAILSSSSSFDINGSYLVGASPNATVNVNITSPLNNDSTAVVIENVLLDSAIPGLMPTIEVDHWANHEGLFYTSSWNMTMNTGGERRFMWCNPADTHFHLTGAHVGSSAGPIMVEIYEQPTITNNGTLTNMTRMNRHENRNETHDFTYYVDTITSNDGTFLFRDFLLGTNNRADDIISLPEEWIMHDDFCYVIVISNQDGNNVQVHGSFSGIDVPVVS